MNLKRLKHIDLSNYKDEEIWKSASKHLSRDPTFQLHDEIEVKTRIMPMACRNHTLAAIKSND